MNPTDKPDGWQWYNGSRIAQFELCCLRAKGNDPQLGENLLRYVALRTGRIWWEKNPTERREVLAACSSANYDWIESQLDDQEFRILAEDTEGTRALPPVALIVGAELMQLTFGDREVALIGAMNTERHVRKCGPEGAGFNMVRLADRKLLFDLRDGKVKPEEFQLICAVRSAVGNRPFAQLTREQMVARMHGFSTPAKFKQDRSGYAEIVLDPANLKRISRAAEKIANRDKPHFRKYTPAATRRITFFSCRGQSQEQLEWMVDDKMRKSSAKRLASTDRELAAVRAKHDEATTIALKRQQIADYRKKTNQLLSFKNETQPENVVAVDWQNQTEDQLAAALEKLADQSR